MAETTTITIRVPQATRDQLDRLAKLTERSRSYLAAEALETYLRNELEIVEGALEGIADFEAGRFFTHQEMVEYSEQLFAEAAARKGESDGPVARKRVAAQ